MVLEKSISTKSDSHLFLSQWLLIFFIVVLSPVLRTPPKVFLPFLPFLDTVKEFETLGFILYGILIISIICVIFQYYPQFSITVLGVGIFLIILADRTRFSNNLCYAACLMILNGVYTKETPWIFRVQIGLLYFGAGLNKLLDPDWLNGQYFENFARNVFSIPGYAQAAEIFPKMILSKVMGILTIVFELGIAIFFLARIRLPEAAVIAYFFHGIMLILTQGVLSIVFFYLMGISMLLAMDYPKNKIIVNYPRRYTLLMGVLRRFDLDNSFAWKQEHTKFLHLTINNMHYSSISSWIRLMLYHKYFHFSGLVFYIILWFITIIV